MQPNLLNDLLKNELFGKLIGNALEKQLEKVTIYQKITNYFLINLFQKETCEKETNTSDLIYEILDSLKEKVILVPLDTFNRLESSIEKLESNISLLNEKMQNSPSILHTIQNTFDTKNKYDQNDEVKIML